MNLFELFVKIGVKDEASGNLKRIGQNLGNGLKTAAKVGTAAVGAASAAIAALTTQAVNSFAEYEQLAGGAQKIFDQMDYRKIANDANNAYKELGLSANQYLAIINDVGATFAATMGDEAGYEAAKTGLKAISDYASGTGKNVDELSQKFTLITRSTSSYQSIADQFSGILPATSKDFLDQAKAAGVLSKKYKKLTDVPVAEYQQAVSEMLEKGVKDIGLYDNTVIESEKTISGSLAATKAAWSNLVTGIADDNADIEQLTSNLVESITNLFNNAAPVAENAFNTIIETAKTGFEDIDQYITESEFGDYWVSIKDTIEDASTKIQTAWEDLEEAIQPLIDSFNDYVQSGQAAADATSLINKAIETLSTVVSEAVTGISNFITFITSGSTGADVFTAAVVGLTAAFVAYQAIASSVSAVTKGLTAAQTLLNAVMNANPFVLITTLIIGLVAAIITLWNTNDGFRNALISAWEGIKASANTIFTSIANFFKETIPNAFNSVLDWFKNVGQKFADIGKNIVDGIKTGIKNAWENLKEWFTSLFGDLIDIAKKILGIKSPSRVFRDQIGKQMAAGLGLGWEEGFKKVKSDIQDSLDFENSISGASVSVRKVGVKSSGIAYGGVTFGDIIIEVNGDRYRNEEKLAEALSIQLQKLTDRRIAARA